MGLYGACLLYDALARRHRQDGRYPTYSLLVVEVEAGRASDVVIPPVAEGAV